jgi:hypothetical protein
MKTELILVNDSDGTTPWSSVESVRSIEPSALKPRGDRLMSRWTYVIGTKAVAQWACNAQILWREIRLQPRNSSTPISTD